MYVYIRVCAAEQNKEIWGYGEFFSYCGIVTLNNSGVA